MEYISEKPARGLLAELFILSAGVLGFEITLTRLYSVSQFYHFAFMIVSVALLGFGASGTLLCLFHEASQQRFSTWCRVSGTGTALSMLGAYLFTNHLPFDSFQIAWNRSQLILMLVHYLVLSIPFLCAGTFISLCLTRYTEVAGRIYAVNMGGSALGCLLGMLYPQFGGGEGTVVFFSAFVAMAVLLTLRKKDFFSLLPWVNVLILSLAIADLVLVSLGYSHPSSMRLKISPYKGLSYALQYPDAYLISQKWNSFSRVDLVHSAGIRSLPGLSIKFPEPPPPEDGIFVDGNDLSPVILPGSDYKFVHFLPLSIAMSFLDQPKTLVLEPRGGLDLLTAVELGAKEVTAVELNPLIVKNAAWIYALPEVTLNLGLDRSFLRQSDARYDLIIVSLTNSYHPIRSGAYSLIEDYRNTVEAYTDAFSRLNEKGILFITRWLQDPPSESLRTFATLIHALEHHQLTPETHLIAFRSYNTISFIASRSTFTQDQLDHFKAKCEQLAYDLVYYPGINAEETNRFTILPEPIHYQLSLQLLQIPDRQEFYRTYPYDVSPSTDDHPFFGHYFKWSQLKQIIREYGKTWQPFGGAGFLILVLLLVVVLIIAVILIWLPMAFTSLRKKQTGHQVEAPQSTVASNEYPLPVMSYFAFIGLAYLFVEIPLIQKFILFLGHPAYALAVVLFSLLTFSALGSMTSHRVKSTLTLGILVITLLATPWALNAIFSFTLGYSIFIRIILSIVTIMPLGFLMGIPFPSGIIQLRAFPNTKRIVPWIWAVNGTASVVASILAALLALSSGFKWVFWLGAICYLCAYISFMVLRYLYPPLRQHQ